jgi:hypothetical protein
MNWKEAAVTYDKIPLLAWRGRGKSGKLELEKQTSGPRFEPRLPECEATKYILDRDFWP